MTTIDLEDKRKRNIILADPPWEYKKNSFKTGNAEDHYSTMSLKELKELNISEYTSNNCILFMWTTGPLMKQSIELLETWGFEYKTMFAVWVKTDGTYMGHYTRQKSEFVLMGTKGKIHKFKKLNCPYIENTFEFKNQEHSKKPIHLKKMIDQIFENIPKLELFSRNSNDLNWDHWGNETEKFGKNMDIKKKRKIRDEQHSLVDTLMKQKKIKGKMIDKANIYGLERNNQQILNFK
jgi:N6-adenosine-specific RNA methylase IME4